MDNEAPTASQMQAAPEPKQKARRGGQSKRAWFCCFCSYLNSSGQFDICSNPEKKDCCDKYSPEQQKQRPESKQDLNHQRCNECTPPNMADWDEGHDRHWKNRMGVLDKLEMDETAEAHHVYTDAVYFDKELLKILETNEPATKRDPVTYQLKDKNELDPRARVGFESENKDI